MMLIKASGTHLNTHYEDVQNQDIHHKDCLNAFGKKKKKLCKDLLKESDFTWSNGFVFGETTKQKKPRKQNYLQNSVALRVQFRKTKKKDASIFIFRCYYFYVLSFKII